MNKPKLKLVKDDKNGPSLSFLMLRRNPFMESPQKFIPTKKRPDDVII